MSEFIKAPPFLINSSKPEKGNFPYGMELLSRSFFQKLKQNILPKGKPYFEALLNSNKENVFVAIYNLLPFITNNKLKTSLISQFLRGGSMAKLFAQAYIAGNSTELRHHRLYSDISRSDIEKSGNRDDGLTGSINFPKTGSELHIFGGENMGKLIIRVIEKEAYESWLKALNAKEIWQNAGFDYIPIEPIYKNNSGELDVEELEDGKMAVCAKVLGPSLYSFLKNKKNKQYRPLLEQKANIIEETLGTKLKIIQGHTHYGNFCVEIIDEKPLLYLIDFDRAHSIE